MRNHPNLPSPLQIETNKRLRLICEFFYNLNERLIGISKPSDSGLPKNIISEIEAQNFDPSDLMAIRNTPGKWTRRNPYQWLWILHRYQNKSR